MGIKRSNAALKSFLRFSGSSAICFLLDYGLFTLLNSALLVSLPDGTRELCATYGARVVSAVTNFLLNRLLVFKDKGTAGRSIWRYALLAVVQASLSAVLVSVLQDLTHATNLLETVIKIPVDGVLFLASYQIQKRWVFRSDRDQ